MFNSKFINLREKKNKVNSKHLTDERLETVAPHTTNVVCAVVCCMTKINNYFITNSFHEAILIVHVP
jgi:hypothetical protein